VTQPLLSAPQVAERLGVNVKTVRKMIGLGQLPSRWVGSRHKVPAQAVEQFVAVKQGTAVGTVTALVLLDALTATPEGQAVTAALRRALQDRQEDDR
jgi:excisionase family DNA binding protein